MIGWQRYYEAQLFLDQGSAGETTADLHLAELLGYAPLDLLRNNMGTNFLTVREVRSLDAQGDSLSDVFAWFVHGDPWHVLLGVGPNSVLFCSFPSTKVHAMSLLSAECWLKALHTVAIVWCVCILLLHVSKATVGWS